MKALKILKGIESTISGYRRITLDDEDRPLIVEGITELEALQLCNEELRKELRTCQTINHNLQDTVEAHRTCDGCKYEPERKGIYAESKCVYFCSRSKQDYYEPKEQQ